MFDATTFANPPILDAESFTHGFHKLPPVLMGRTSGRHFGVLVSGEDSASYYEGGLDDTDADDMMAFAMEYQAKVEKDISDPNKPALALVALAMHAYLRRRLCTMLPVQGGCFHLDTTAQLLSTANLHFGIPLVNMEFPYIAEDAQSEPGVVYSLPQVRLDALVDASGMCVGVDACEW